MAKYAVNSEGVESLNKLSEQLIEGLQEIGKVADGLQSSLDSNSNGLGPHADSIESIVETIKQKIEQAKEPIEELSEGIADLAESYQDTIDNNIYSGVSL